MSDFLDSFKIKSEEIYEYIELVWVFDNLPEFQFNRDVPNKSLDRKQLKRILEDQTYRVSSEQLRILKANCFLLLYNLVEGSLTASLNELFASIEGNGVRYSECIDIYKDVWIKYRYTGKSIDRSLVNTIETIANDVFSIARTERKNEKKEIIGYWENYQAYTNTIGKTEISGNIDARQIGVISKNYGFDLGRNRNCDDLLLVKRNRNRLAHGEITFSELGQDYTLEQINGIAKEVIKFMENFLNVVDEYIVQQKYRV